MAIDTVGVIVNFPIPELTAALKNFAGVGAVPAAGSPKGYVMAFEVAVQVVLTTQTLVTPVIVDAVVDKVCIGLVVVNVVEVIVMFQPFPEPVKSDAVMARV
jgi:hypothetical protein